MAAEQNKLRVMIVEDEIVLADQLEYALGELGYDVVGIADTSKKALAMAEDTQPDLALIDIHLKDGPTGVALARRVADISDTRCVFVSSSLERIPDAGTSVSPIRRAG